MLSLPADWIWDSWYAFDGKYHHAFYLKAPKSLIDPELRHRNPSVGHARSLDLIDWEILPDALAPSSNPSWDSWTTWTGSVIRADDGVWWMFYTGTSNQDGGDIQRVGAATSADLMTWTKLTENPLTQAAPTWYEKLDYELWHDEAWRDPWVFRYENNWHMFTTARHKVGSKYGRGTIGHAKATDLTNWEVLPPLIETESGFGQLEVFQLIDSGGFYTLLWCCGPNELSEAMRTKYPSGGMFSTTSNSPLGPFDPNRAIWFPDPNLYAARAIQHNSNWYLIGFINNEAGQFGGYLSDPIPIRLTETGIVPNKGS